MKKNITCVEGESEDSGLKIIRFFDDQKNELGYIEEVEENELNGDDYEIVTTYWTHLDPELTKLKMSRCYEEMEEAKKDVLKALGALGA